MDYPLTRKDAVVDDYFGTPVADPYRWLEDPNSPETRAWLEAQNAIARAFLERLPARDRIHRRLTELWSRRPNRSTSAPTCSRFSRTSCRWTCEGALLQSTGGTTT
jgi:protease II